MLSSILCTRKSPIFVTAFVVITSSYFFIFDFFAGTSSGFLSSFLAGSDFAGSAGLSSAQMAGLETSKELIQIQRIQRGRSRKNMRYRVGQKVARFKRKGGIWSGWAHLVAAPPCSKVTQQTGVITNVERRLFLT